MSETNDGSDLEGFTAGDRFFGQMREAGVADDKFVTEIVEMFLQEGEISLEKIQEGFLLQDVASIRLYAHKLKSSFLMFDMDEAHLVCVKLELSDADNLKDSFPNYERLTVICKTFFKLLRQKYIK